MTLGVPFDSWQGNQALSHVDGDISVFWTCGMTPGIPLEFQGETGLLLRCDMNVQIPYPMKQGNGPPYRGKEKTGVFLSWGGTLGVPLQLRRVCWGTS